MAAALNQVPVARQLFSGNQCLNHEGRTFVTNGPLLGLEIDGKHPGDDITLAKPTILPYHASLRSIVPIDHFELIFNGRVVASHHLNGTRTQADVSSKVKIPGSG
jgi:hypothetical protein